MKKIRFLGDIFKFLRHNLTIPCSTFVLIFVLLYLCKIIKQFYIYPRIFRLPFQFQPLRFGLGLEKTKVRVKLRLT